MKILAEVPVHIYTLMRINYSMQTLYLSFLDAQVNIFPCFPEKLHVHLNINKIPLSRITKKRRYHETVHRFFFSQMIF